MTESYKSVQEVAGYLGIQPDNLYKWVSKKYKNIPAHKVGRLWKFKISEIDRLVKRSK